MWLALPVQLERELPVLPLVQELLVQHLLRA
jgi:hypothetical protein